VNDRDRYSISTGSDNVFIDCPACGSVNEIRPRQQNTICGTCGSSLYIEYELVFRELFRIGDKKPIRVPSKFEINVTVKTNRYTYE
jgi:hypothetical protein